MTDKYKIEKCSRRLAEEEEMPERLNLLYQWTKTGHVNREEFRLLAVTVCFLLEEENNGD